MSIQPQLLLQAISLHNASPVSATAYLDKHLQPPVAFTLMEHCHVEFHLERNIIHPLPSKKQLKRQPQPPPLAKVVTGPVTQHPIVSILKKKDNPNLRIELLNLQRNKTLHLKAQEAQLMRKEQQEEEDSDEDVPALEHDDYYHSAIDEMSDQLASLTFPVKKKHKKHVSK